MNKKEYNNGPIKNPSNDKPKGLCYSTSIPKGLNKKQVDNYIDEFIREIMKNSDSRETGTTICLGSMDVEKFKELYKNG